MNCKLLFILPAVLFLASCEPQEIMTYDVKDSAVIFQHKSEQFSLRGVTQERTRLTVKLDLYGPVVDYDRPISVVVADSEDNNAVQGVDFDIVEACLPAGEMNGKIILDVKMVSMEEPTKVTTLQLQTNDSFIYLGSESSVTRVSWSDEYLRPGNQWAWQSWFYFFGPVYSKNYHKLLVEVLGDEIEHSGYSNGAKNDPDTDYRVLTWWYAKANEFYEYVKAHDTAHPDDPYMHSDDFEQYTSYLTPVGSGVKPAGIPTILSTIQHN